MIRKRHTDVVLPTRAMIAAAAMALSPIAGPLQAQDQEPPTDTPIVVETDRPNSVKEVKSLAREISGKVELGRPIARFQDAMCLDVAGLNPEYHERFVRRVNANAEAAGVRIARSGCKPNAMVLFADDSREQLLGLRKANRFIFGDMPRSEFRDMLASKDRVYAWQVNEVVGLMGGPRDENNEFGSGVFVNRVIGFGRLSPSIRIVTRSSAVVIESRQTEGKTPEQLADYATMRLIAPTGERPADSVGGPATIMTLFSDPAGAPDGLTAFDLAYLESVYAIRPNGPVGRLYVETGQRVEAEASQ
jgi:hypothetical protein